MLPLQHICPIGKLQFRQGTALLQSCKDRQLQLIEKPGILFPSGCPLTQNFCQHLFFHSPAPLPVSVCSGTDPLS